MDYKNYSQEKKLREKDAEIAELRKLLHIEENWPLRVEPQTKVFVDLYSKPEVLEVPALVTISRDSYLALLAKLEDIEAELEAVIEERNLARAERDEARVNKKWNNGVYVSGYYASNTTGYYTTV